MESQNFVNLVFPLGNIQENTTYHCVFAKKPGVKGIVGLSAGCGCTTPDNNPDHVSVWYNSTSIPPELLEIGEVSMPVEKYVTVQFDDNTAETLKITGTIRKADGVYIS